MNLDGKRGRAKAADPSQSRALRRSKRRIPRARGIRLGMVTIAFVTEDGKTIGILVGKGKGKYGWMEAMWDTSD